MRKNIFKILLLLPLTGFLACEKDSEITSLRNIEDVGLKVSFGNSKGASSLKNTSSMTSETPENYFVALKKATLIGTNGTSNFNLLNELDLTSSFVFDYTDDNTVHSLLDSTEIPDG